MKDNRVIEESRILSEKDKNKLYNSLEDSCQLMLPKEKERIGEITFHLYHYENIKNDIGSAKKHCLFQIRWGSHKIYSKKHLNMNPEKSCLDILTKAIQADRKQIKNALVEYCKNQLSSIVIIEFELEINKKSPNLTGYELQVCKCRKKNVEMNNSGWPNFCIFISWYDELGDFQEFIFPIKLDPESRLFQIPTQKIVSDFLVYRDTVI